LYEKTIQRDLNQIEILLAIAEGAYKRAMIEENQEDIKYWRIRIKWIKRIIKKR
jgi:hypothetical protein